MQCARLKAESLGPSPNHFRVSNLPDGDAGPEPTQGDERIDRIGLAPI